MLKKMLYYGQIRGLRFLAPNDGGGGGGNGGSTNGGAGASNEGGQQQEEIKTPFDDLPWDELPEADQLRLQKAKDEFVATVQLVPKLKADLEKTTNQAKQFQSRADRTEAEL